MNLQFKGKLILMFIIIVLIPAMGICSLVKSFGEDMAKRERDVEIINVSEDKTLSFANKFFENTGYILESSIGRIEGKSGLEEFSFLPHIEKIESFDIKVLEGQDPELYGALTGKLDQVVWSYSDEGEPGIKAYISRASGQGGISAASAELDMDILREELDQTQAEPGAYYYLVDDRDRVVIAPQDSVVAEDFYEISRFDGLKIFERDNYFTREIDGKEYMVAFNPIGESGWHILAVLEKSGFGKIENQFFSDMILWVILSVFFGVFTIIVFAQVIKKKLDIIHVGIDQIARKNYSYGMALKGKDEFGKISNSFNKMAENLRAEIRDRKKAEK